MSIIAKGEITLSPINDAYTVSLSPATCTIHAGFDGSNPKLDNAATTIAVKRGAIDVDFKVIAPHVSIAGIEYAYTQQPDKSLKVFITKIPSTILNGWVSFDIETEDGFHYATSVQFNFTVVRETSMLDWILDWEGGKTKVGGTYIMTPKLFIGNKEDVVSSVDGVPTWKPGALTGVYIGPELLNDGEGRIGLYGYYQDEEIFHLNANGGCIGGWNFTQSGLASRNGVVTILSEGSIYAESPSVLGPYWGLYADGHAIFANGKVKFQPDGSAEYAGKITSSKGEIGGWRITPHQLHNQHIVFDANQGIVGVYADGNYRLDIDGNMSLPASPQRGVKMWYTSMLDYGFAGWNADQKVFQLGSTNMIAGWSFNHQAIWTGSNTPSLAQNGYTPEENALTIAPNGIRSHNWFVDANGAAAFVSGAVKFHTDSAEMFGWTLKDKRLASSHIVLSSDPEVSGMFLSTLDLSDAGSTNLVNLIKSSGGLYLHSSANEACLCSYNAMGHVQFCLSSSDTNIIGGWKFDNLALYSDAYCGSGFTSEGIVIGVAGIRSEAWRLEKDGSGALAKGGLSWDSLGNISLKGASISIIDASNNTVALFDSKGYISAALINVNSLECRDVNDNHLISGINQTGDGAFCIYYPSGQIMMRYGYDNSNGIESIAQHYLPDGTLDWVISNKGTTTSSEWSIIDYWSTYDYEHHPDPYRGTATNFYTLVLMVSGDTRYFSAPNTASLYTGTAWSVFCDPRTDETGQTGAYRMKYTIKDGRLVESKAVLMCYPGSGFNWETGEYE